MSGFWGTYKKAKEFHKEVVKQLFDLAFKISIVEKYSG